MAHRAVIVVAKQAQREKEREDLRFGMSVATIANNTQDARVQRLYI